MRSKDQGLYDRIIDAVDGMCLEHGRAPSLSELTRELEIPKPTLYRYLMDLVERNRLVYDGKRIALAHTYGGRSVRVAIVGEVACGLPVYAEENVEEYYTLPESVLGRGEYYVLRAKGDSMIGAGISDGDSILVRRESVASYGDIVVALIGDEATLKRYYPTESGVVLHPENPDYEDITVPICSIQGVAVKVIKDLSL